AFAAPDVCARQTRSRETKTTPHQRSQKQHQQRELYSQKCSYQGHELHVTPAHAFHLAHGLVSKSNSQDERRTQNSAAYGVKQRQDSPVIDTAQNKSGRPFNRHNQAESESHCDAGFGEQIRQQFGLTVSKDQPDQQE